MNNINKKILSNLENGREIISTGLIVIKLGSNFDKMISPHTLLIKKYILIIILFYYYYLIIYSERYQSVLFKVELLQAFILTSKLVKYK